MVAPKPQSPANSSKAPAPTIDATYYAERNWALPTATPTPLKRTLPCDQEFRDVYLDDADEYLALLEARIMLWQGWIENYRERGYHDLPVEIPLAIIMHESRGGSGARGAAGEIGIMQVLPSSANATIKELSQSSKNIYHGIGLLESYTWEAFYYVENTEREYRSLRYASVAQASDLEWWYSDTGRAAIAMYQCGPTGFQLGRCGARGGLVYSSDVLDCWVPWIKEVIEEPEPAPQPEAICRVVLPERRLRPRICIS